MNNKTIKSKNLSSEKNSHDRKYNSRYRSRSRSHDKYSERRHKVKPKTHSKPKSYEHSGSSTAHNSRSCSWERRRYDHKERPSRSRSRSRGRHYRHSSSSSQSSVNLNENIHEKEIEVNSNKRTLRNMTPGLDVVENEKAVPELPIQSVFKNDGSFLEMFKKMQEKSSTNIVEEKKAPMPLTGRRRGGKVLKTGIVEKVKPTEESGENTSKDPWSIYIDEVKKYRQSSCQDEGKTRSLVK